MGEDADAAGWPLDLRGVTEAVVTTRGPHDRWNLAALGLFAGDPVTARTWGRTRTRRNFSARRGGYVQFTRDAVDFVDAACSVRELDDPVLASADAWVRVEATVVESGTDGETEWVEWALEPVETRVERRVVPTTNRGHAAVVEATVAASRLDVAGYDTEDLRDRISFFARVVDRCGSARAVEAFRRLREHEDL